MNQTRTATNARNALRSTGPRSRVGKALSSQNALTHGLRSNLPVIAGLESDEAWLAHEEETIASLRPGGYVETLIASRIAHLLWRTRRISRFEVGAIQGALLRIDDDDARASALGRSHYMAPSHPRELRKKHDDIAQLVSLFHNIEAMTDDGALELAVVERVLHRIIDRNHVDLERVDLSALPAEARTGEWQQLQRWTKRLLNELVDAMAKKRKGTGDDMWASTVSRLDEELSILRRALEETDTRLACLREERVLLSAENLERIQRYETHLDRSLSRALQELSQLQRARLAAESESSMRIEVGFVRQNDPAHQPSGYLPRKELPNVDE